MNIYPKITIILIAILFIVGGFICLRSYIKNIENNNFKNYHKYMGYTSLTCFIYGILNIMFVFLSFTFLYLYLLIIAISVIFSLIVASKYGSNK